MRGTLFGDFLGYISRPPHGGSVVIQPGGRLPVLAASAASIRGQSSSTLERLVLVEVRSFETTSRPA
jgi:hypothetical protein